MTSIPVWPGRHTPLGASFDGEATNFAVWSPDASLVTVCLFDEQGAETRLDLTEHALGVWHGRLPGVGPGQQYGFRAEGPWDPGHSRRFNPAKLLLDPYARAITGEFVFNSAVFGYEFGSPETQDPRDSAPFVPRSVVVADEFDWAGDRRPQVAWSDTVIYELHVKGFTRLHPDVPEHQRGTYAGLAHPAVLDYLVDLGASAVELMPVHQSLSEPGLLQSGRTNYWGYNSIGFFAPQAAYSSGDTTGGQVTEFKQLVKALHSRGLEVILDVVYNHSAEGGPGGPTLSFRGFDDRGYYRHDAYGNYADVTGVGNTLNVSQPQMLTLVMDSLRYWVNEMHVDGFRFDLAPALARDGSDVDLHSPFLSAVGQDPVLRHTKLIAEPWDATIEGYQVGAFPAPWCEWNDRFRDTVRDFWRTQSGGIRDLGNRLTGSSDLYADDGRLPFASVNFVTAHDGLTVRDLVSYNTKHNEANGENNRDGTDNNRSWNCGVEGDTDDGAVVALRRRQIKNLLTTLLLSTGVPMLLGGDERGRTQRGNNNAFCQDNDISWVDWKSEDWLDIHQFVRHLIRLRRAHPVLRQRRFFDGQPSGEGGRKDLTWLHPAGREVAEPDWFDQRLNTVGLFLAGDAIRARGPRGEPIEDDSYLIWLHSGDGPVSITLPGPEFATAYDVELTSDDALSGTVNAHESFRLQARSVAVLRAGAANSRGTVASAELSAIAHVVADAGIESPLAG
jgi:isoamylase